MNLRQAFTRAWRAPGFALAVIVLTAVVVAVNATVFAAVWAIDYKALPYREGDRLVELRVDLRKFGFRVGLLPSLHSQLAAATDVYEGVVGQTAGPFMRSDDAGREWQVQRVTTGFSEVLGVAPMLGRPLQEEDAVGDGRVLLLSEATWRSRFNGDPGVVGSNVDLGGQRYRIVGVMPAGFVFPDRDADAWMPWIPSAGEKADDAGGNVGQFEVLARLAPGVTLQQSAAHLDGVLAAADNLKALREHVGVLPVVRYWRERFADEHTMALALLQLASLILLVVVAANLANLVLDRMMARQRDLAICRALGAGHRDILRSVLADLLPPVVVGAGMGMLLVPLCVALLQQRGLIPANLPVGVGGDAFSIGAAVIAAALVLAVALLAAVSVRSPANLAAGAGVRQQAAGLGRARATMLVVQLALATVLLGASALLLRSAFNLINEPRGFDERGVLMTALDPLGVSRGQAFDPERDGPRARARLLALREDVLSLPGVRHAAFASSAPFSRSETVSTVRVMGVDGDMQARSRQVGPGYFRTLGIAQLAGRDFAAGEGEGQGAEDGTVIVDELFVQRWLAGRDPLGARLEIPSGPDSYRSARVVGVVRTVKHERLDEQPDLPTYYLPADTILPTSLLVTRVDGNPAVLADVVRDRVRGSFPDAVVTFNQPLAEAVAHSLAGRRAALESVSAFATITLLLVVFGLHAVLSLAVRRRTAELGIRMALGAQGGDVQRMVLRQGALLAAAGVVAGVLLGVPLARLIADRLYGIGPHDLPSWLLVAAVVAAAALLACWWPARRAAGTSPLLALQSSNHH
ncbi:ABC transporter permease [Pseudofulvimonas gallinarii]|uniref:Putative ABC transport system permease protein n=1 Tax=Pseudofulvimonas gallinarii TaxID=634155 RepID=A0A4V2UWH6_9GAMM|nr:ABC transporter permease [Pseudofulvimonas gallinarii]TCS99687.1 putative ABC transport system permease protein [Pseudofulvimonas gallinarii]THD15276.1 hypothetical protein B1808_00245 [Pseudofulvimonas gallinarii]